MSVTFDRYPYETIWLIVKGEYGSGLSDDDSLALNTVVESPKYNFGNLNSTDSHIECLPEGTCKLVIVMFMIAWYLLRRCTNDIHFCIRYLLDCRF